MKERLIRVYNQSPSICSLLVRGRKMEIKPYEELKLSEELAEAFFKKYAGVVVEADTMETPTEVHVAPPETTWIANMTGDPRYPEKIKLKVFRNKKWELDEQLNQLSSPLPLKEQKLGAWEEYMTPSGVMSRRGANSWIKLPPYRRIELSNADARWFVQRSAMSVPRAIDCPVRLRKVIRARAPSGFEPSVDWDLDEMIAYLGYVDSLAELPASETKLRTTWSKLPEEDIIDKIEEAKRNLLIRLHFYVCDPKVEIPTRQEFTEYMLGSSEPEGLDEESANALVEGA